ncbi:MAG TPA: LytR C-terminal domain-containing protein [Pseudonocardiaceae bacterium]|nr:LytR C-terminal domain-containing protein [Pseudonocardiaceae bacterium]
MTSQGPARPARLAGFVLLGVAVVAVGFGVFSLTGSSSRPPSANPPGPSVPPVSATTTTRPPATTPKTTPPPTSYPSGQTTTVAPPPGTTGAGGGAAGPGTGTGINQVPVRVYNNSTIKGLAAQATQDFVASGFDVVETGNYSAGDIPTTTAYYTNLPGEQATAQALAQQFGMRAMPRFPGIATASPGVIVIVTNDFKGAQAGGK